MKYSDDYVFWHARRAITIFRQVIFHHFLFVIICYNENMIKFALTQITMISVGHSA